MAANAKRRVLMAIKPGPGKNFHSQCVDEESSLDLLSSGATRSASSGALTTTEPPYPPDPSPDTSPLKISFPEVAPSPLPQGGTTNGSEAPLSGGIIGVAPSPFPQGGITNGSEAPLSGGIIGVATSPISGGIIEFALSPISEGGTTNGTEAPLIGGIIGIAPAPEGGEAPATNDSGAPIVIIVPPAPETEVPLTTNNFETELIINAKGSENGNHDGIGSDEEPREKLNI
ncbi:unnamed protein product [Arabis nemorensis]|uniref:Uncharacterized protein n=1 Tax=Arabis nemorensis TaxID=586526 RepID=A0A565BAU2_9BRAS|nr:unnamed protein product [Arabis nemorensis]